MECTTKELMRMPANLAQVETFISIRKKILLRKRTGVMELTPLNPKYIDKIDVNGIVIKC